MTYTETRWALRTSESDGTKFLLPRWSFLDHRGKRDPIIPTFPTRQAARDAIPTLRWKPTRPVTAVKVELTLMVIAK